MKGHHSNLRKGRFSQSGQIYHIVFRAHEQILADADKVILCRCFLDADLIRNHNIMTWVVMPDHVHLLIQLGEGQSLSQFVGRLKSRSAARINKLRKQKSQIWAKAFYDRAIRRDEDVQSVARYIVANPIRAGSVKSVRDYSYWNAIWL